MTTHEPIHLSSDRIPSPLANYSQATRIGDLIFLAGQLPTDFKTAIPADVSVKEAYPYYGSAIEMQTRMVLQNIQTLLEDVGSDLAHVVKTQVFIQHCDLFNDFDRVWKEFFPVPPPRSTVEIGDPGLLIPGALVEIDVIAVPVDGSATPEAIPGDSLPKPLANYTPCTRYGDWLFLAGQLPTDFSPQGVPDEAQVDSNFPYYGSAIEKQTDYTLRNLAALLEEAGSDLDHVVKAQVFLKDLKDFDGFDQVWQRHFDTPPPRTTIQVGNLLVADALIEIDLIAIRRDGALTIERIATDDAPSPATPHTQAVKVGDVVFLSGQLATDFQTGVPAGARVDPHFPFHGSDIERQTQFILDNCDAVMRAAGTDLQRTAKSQVFLTDLANFYGLDKVWKRAFDKPPARSAIAVAGDGLLVPGCLVEVDLIAAAS